LTFFNPGCKIGEIKKKGGVTVSKQKMNPRVLHLSVNSIIQFIAKSKLADRGYSKISSQNLLKSIDWDLDLGNVKKILSLGQCQLARESTSVLNFLILNLDRVEYFRKEEILKISKWLKNSRKNRGILKEFLKDDQVSSREGFNLSITRIAEMLTLIKVLDIAVGEKMIQIVEGTKLAAKKVIVFDRPQCRSPLTWNEAFDVLAKVKLIDRVRMSLPLKLEKKINPSKTSTKKVINMVIAQTSRSRSSVESVVIFATPKVKYYASDRIKKVKDYLQKNKTLEFELKCLTGDKKMPESFEQLAEILVAMAMAYLAHYQGLIILEWHAEN